MRVIMSMYCSMYVLVLFKSAQIQACNCLYVHKSGAYTVQERVLFTFCTVILTPVLLQKYSVLKWLVGNKVLSNEGTVTPFLHAKIQVHRVEISPGKYPDPYLSFLLRDRKPKQCAQYFFRKVKI